jgi:hypothetical protein
MSAVPLQKPSPELPPETVEQRFRRLEAAWNADTCFLSDPNRIIGHPAFQEIVRMGEAVIPLMLSDLEKEPRQWVWALPLITGEDPAPPEFSDGFIKWDMRKMREEWLRWGREKGYRW